MSVKVLSTLTGFTGNLNIPEAVAKHPAGIYVDKTNMPTHLIHGAVQAFGKVYEFNTGHGILVYNDPAAYMRSYSAIIEGGGETSRGEKELQTWMFEQKQNFTKTNYDPVDRNCSHFTASVCAYLGVREPANFVKQRDWVVRNQPFVRALESGRSKIR